MTPTRLLRLMRCAGFAALMLSACQSAPTRIYTLYAVPPDAPHEAYAGPPIRVDAVHFPPALDRIEIVRNLAPGELSLSDVDHWSAPLGQEARQALSADLVARLPAGKTVFPHLTKPDGALGLTVDVLDFRTDSHGASLEVSWVLSVQGQATATGPGTGTGTGTAVFRSERAAGDSASAGAADGHPVAGSPAATARALSTLLARLADRIVSTL